jgi:hypothetical protein
MLERLRNNPVLVSGFVTALLGLLMAFGLNLSDVQLGAIMAFVGSVLAIVARGKVTPNRKL